MQHRGEIVVSNVTKDYGSGKGIFDVSLSVEKGEVFGFLGPNGAGKTVTIRNLLGFIKPDSGTCQIKGMPCFQAAPEIQRFTGYLAGEIVFLDDMNGEKLLNFIAEMKQMKSRKRMLELCDLFELNLTGKVKKMSKGMKQKLGLIMAFMDEPEILILDEPTSGLDPLMQSKFVDLVLEEKKMGKTIFMSSHMFEEVEKTCDRTAIIKDGHIVSIEEMHQLKHKKRKTYILSFPNEDLARSVEIQGFEVKERHGNTIAVSVKDNLQKFLALVAQLPVIDVETRTETLEELFMHYYDQEGK
ncbi:ABC-2 type transport system ATP-binding protein [Clostridiales Family XIII bacterium PM5-7]